MSSSKKRMLFVPRYVYAGYSRSHIRKLEKERLERFREAMAEMNRKCFTGRFWR